MHKIALCLLTALSTIAATAAPEQVLSLKTDIVAWTAPHSLSNGSAEVLSTLGISNLSVNLCIDEGNMFAIARIVTTHADARAVWLSLTNSIRLETVANDTYKWLPPKPPQGTPDMFNQDTLLVGFSGNAVLVADADHFDLAEQLGSESTAGLMECSVHIAPMVDPFFTMVRNILDKEHEGFMKSILSGVTDGLEKAAQSVKEFPRISMTVNATADQQRSMDLALEFMSSSIAEQTQAFFANPETAWKTPEITDTRLSLVELAASPDFKGLEVEGNIIRFKYEWPAERDMEMLKTIASPLTDNLMSLASGGEKYPINAEEILADPMLKSLSDFDAEQLEQVIRSSTFFERQSYGQVQFVVDYLDIPNKEMMKTSITNVTLLTTNGVNIATENPPAYFSINSDEQAGHIYLKTERDGPTAETATFTFQIKIPVEIKTITLSPESPLYEEEDRGCCLLGISNSVVRIRSKKLSIREANIFARTSNGNYIKRSGASWSDSKYNGTYNGLPESVEIVIPVRYEIVSIDFNELPVTKDAEIKMPDTPTNSVPMRYTAKPIPVFSDPDIEVFAHGAMTIETHTGHRKDQCILRFPKPTDVKIRSLSLRSYLAGSDAFIFMGRKGGFSYSQGFYNWSANQQALPPDATAVFGEVTAAFWTGTGNYTVNVSTNPVPLIEGRDEPSVWSQHNVVWIKINHDENILDVQAYASDGRRLKRDNRTSHRNNSRGYYFWGEPTRAMIAYATGTVTSTVPFEIELKPEGLAAIPENKARASAFKALIDEVIQIEKDTSRFRDLLAANYYGSNSNNEPMARISLEIAHSDPAGAAIFGYEVKPYKGYHFRRITRAGDANRNTSSFGWTGGSFEAGGDGHLLATPVDENKPAILMLWGNVYFNYSDCSQIKEIDTNSTKMAEDGWLQVW